MPGAATPCPCVPLFACYELTLRLAHARDSNIPVYESICVTRGAKHCVTLEYNDLSYEHPDMHTFTVQTERHPLPAPARSPTDAPV